MSENGHPAYEERLAAVQDGVARVVERYGRDPEMLIQMLLELQAEFRWLPEEMLASLARTLAIPLARLYRIATFYKAFSLAPKGQYVFRVCTGTACQVRGASLIIAVAERLLKISCGETTPDMRHTLETVNCVGCCPIAPVVLCGEHYHGKVRPAGVKELLAAYQ